MKTVTVNVTAEHIAKGERGKCAACPIALALQDATGIPWDVAWTAAYPYCTVRRWELPPLVQHFVRDFDMKHPVAPFAFELPAEFAGKAGAQ